MRRGEREDVFKKLGLVLSSWFGTNWFQMKISAHKLEKALMFFALYLILLSEDTLLFSFFPSLSLSSRLLVFLLH